VVVEDLTPAVLSLGEIQRVLHALLDEGVSIRDLVRIFEALSVAAKSGTEPDRLVEAARMALAPAITAAHTHDGTLSVLTLDPRLQQSLLESVRPAESGFQLLPGPEVVEALVTDTARQYQRILERGLRPVLACAPQIRLPLRRLVATTAPDLPVLSYSEISTNATSVDSLGVIGDARTVGV
jgi:flagellar biosynthesis protein FlhA